MATLNDVLTYARYLAQTDSNGITDTLGTAFANDALQNSTRSLFERDIEAGQTKEAYTTLTTSDSPIGQFLWPSDMFFLKTVEIDYSGVGGQQYLQARPIDMANIQFVSWDWLRQNQPSNDPLFDNRGDYGEVFPSPTGNSLIRIFYYVTPTEYTTTSDTIAYPFSLDYRALSARVAALFALQLEKQAVYERCEKEYERRIADIIRILAPSSQQPVQSNPIQLSGWNF